MSTQRDAAISTVAVLADPSRRRLFDVVRRAGRALTREEAAAAVGVSRKLAAFHLDKLVAAGLLHARAHRPAGPRRVGRAPKVYEPAAGSVTVSIPERRPELLAEILVAAMAAPDGAEPTATTAQRVARRRGAALGSDHRASVRPGRLGPERALSLAEPALERLGFEPVRATATSVRLANCPFHPLAARAPDLVCGLNQAFLAGYLDGLGATPVHAVLSPQPGWCCVELRAWGGDGSEAQARAICRRLEPDA